jgi:purine-binding chemotaxis protein CheW
MNLDDATDRFIVFMVQGSSLAVPLLAVREVLAVKAVTPQPGRPAYFKGLIEIRNQVLPVLDLMSRMGAPQNPSAESSYGETQPCLLVFHNGGKPFGVPVDYIADVVSLSSKDIESRKPDMAAGVTGVARTRLGMVTLVNVASYFQSGDFEVITP